jgi:hypothetical protein
MKKTFLLAFVLMSFSVFAQEQDTLFMSKLMDKEWAQDFGNQTQFKFIKFQILLRQVYLVHQLLEQIITLT